MSQGLKLFIGIFVIILIAALCVVLIYYKGMTNAVFVYCFKRNYEKKWLRGCSDVSDKKLYRMWEEGKEFAKSNKSYLKNASIYSDNLKLCADYYDFGFEKAVIIIPGMYETAEYSNYFANVYKENGFNCLLIDNRATGLSEGDYNIPGLYESEDIIEWARHLNSKENINQIILHGISSGAATALSAANLKSCPAYIKGLILDETYCRFDDFFKNFMEYKKYNTMVHKAVMKRIKKITGTDPGETSPESFISEIDIPALFLASAKDQLVPAENVQELFDNFGTACGNKEKRLVWFENGEHGFIRLCDDEKYDGAIKDFIEKR